MARQRTEQLLTDFTLSHAADRPVKTYSGGMRRRLDLAASLIAEPQVLFLDEPTTGLDPPSRSRMWDVIRGLVDGGTTLLLTTQYLEEADQLADQIVVIDGGRAIAEGTSAELKSRLGGECLDITVHDEQAGRAGRRLAGTLRVGAAAARRGGAAGVGPAERRRRPGWSRRSWARWPTPACWSTRSRSGAPRWTTSSWSSPAIAPSSR